MTKSIYISGLEANSGKSLVSVGIVDTLLKRTGSVGYFKPIILDTQEKDDNITLVLGMVNSKQTYDESFSFQASEMSDLLEEGKFERIIERIIVDYKNLEKKHDVVLIEGTDFVGENSHFEFEINARIAQNIGAPVLLIGNGKGKKPKELARQLHIALDQFEEFNCEVIGTIVNKVKEADTDDYLSMLREKLGGTGKKKLFSAIPQIPTLSAPMLSEVAETLEAQVLFGEEELNQKQMHRVSIAAMQLKNYLEFMSEGCVVVTPADRLDIILGTLQANQSKNYPSISGIVLTGIHDVDNVVINLLEGLKRTVPILKVKTNTFNTALALDSIVPKLKLEYKTKFNAAIREFNSHVDVDYLINKFTNFKTDVLTPKMFRYRIMEMATANKKHIVLPEGEDDRILKATEILSRDGVVKVTLLGDPKTIKDKITNSGLAIDLEKVAIINPSEYVKFDQYVETLYEARKHKNVTRKIAEDLMRDVSYFGTMMVFSGDADGMVSGAVHTTQHTIRPALQFVKTKPNVNVVSSVFFMCLEHKVLVYGDCAVNPNPTATQLAEIAISSAQTAKNFGLEPKVAMLSYSSGESGKGEEVEKVREATKLVKASNPDLLIEGPIQYDAAVDLQVGQKKMPNSLVAGKANVLIFPDLNTGNNTYKAVQRETGALAIGPVLQGLNKPINDLSRGCTVDDIVNTVIITAVQAQED